MLTSGDLVILDLGRPEGREAGMARPAVVVTAQRILEGAPSVVHIVPLTTTIRNSMTEVNLDPDPGNGLTAPSAAQCHQMRAVSVERIDGVIGNVGPSGLAEIRETIALLLDIP
jgi:mRNA interferase MazF